MSNITLNIVEPGSGPTPDLVVPNTGLFTHGIGGPEATIIAVSTILVLALVAFVVWHYKKHTNIHLSNITKHIKTRKSIAIGLTVLAILVSAGTFIALAKNAVNATDTDDQAEGDDSSLIVDVSSEELTIEVGDEPVFAVLPVKVSVEQATQAGYTLTAYAEDTNLVSTTDPSNVISMVTLPEPLVPNEEGVGRGWGPVTKLTDNTYGLTLVEPESEEDELYMPLSISSDNPTIIKSMTEYTPTEENDTTTIYYGFYITPDTPYGTYTNDGEVYYNATINTTLVTFDGNDLYFDEDEGKTTNEVEYIAVSQEESEDTINQITSGEYKEPSQALPYIFLGWSTDPEATVPTYTNEENIAQFLPILPSQPITLYAVWQKATTITFDNNGGTGTMQTQTIIAGESDNLNPNEFTREGYHFTGWNTESNGSGRSYDDETDYTAPADSGYVTLYAQWEEDVLYMQDVATWGNNLQQGDEITAVDNRDGKGYTVARLADNNIWMTQNLDLCIGCDGVAALDSNNTDLVGTTGYGGLYNEGYSNNNGVISWIPSRQPLFIDGGEMYIYPSDFANEDVVYNSLDECVAGGHPKDLCSHYHVGNFYSWGIANATNSPGGSSSSDNPNSICPAGWKLPSARNQDNDFSNLLYASNIIANRGNASYADNGFAKLRGEPFYFVRGGRYANSDMVSLAQTGYYWSRDFRYSYDYPSSQREAFFVEFSSSAVYSSDRNTAGTDYSSWSIPVRCTARTY